MPRSPDIGAHSGALPTRQVPRSSTKSVLEESSLRVNAHPAILVLKTDYDENTMREWSDFQEATREVSNHIPSATDVLIIQTKDSYYDIFRFRVERGTGVFYLYVPGNGMITVGSEWTKVAERGATPFTKDDGSQGMNRKQEIYAKQSNQAL
jgi:hypothetical protein